MVCHKVLFSRIAKFQQYRSGLIHTSQIWPHSIYRLSCYSHKKPFTAGKCDSSEKISHSSQALRQDNIRGSFNGSDIMRNFEGVENIPENFESLFHSHENYTFEENLVRLVEATNQIAPTGSRFMPSAKQIACIQLCFLRKCNFLFS